MNDAVLSINATLGARASKEVQGLENKVKASMRAVLKENWMEVDDMNLFKAGIGGALSDVGSESEDGKRILTTLDAMRKLNAFLMAAKEGLSPDVSKLIDESGEPPLPLLAWWNEAKK